MRDIIVKERERGEHSAGKALSRSFHGNPLVLSFLLANDRKKIYIYPGMCSTLNVHA